MSVWTWDDVPHQILPIANAPAPAALAASLVPGEPPISEKFDRWLEEQTGLELLCIVEWSVCTQVPALFKLLRDNGSTHGYVVDQGEGFRAEDRCRKIELSDQVAQRIYDDKAMEPTMAFVDDTKNCALVSWWSDHAWICLSQELFGQYLERHPLDLTLGGDGGPYPLATTLSAARALSERREKAWNAPPKA